MKKFKSEDFIKELFFAKYNIDCVQIKEQKKRQTPDFLLRKNGIDFAICEVKEMTDDINDGTWGKIGDSSEKTTGLAFGKIADKIVDSYNQLKQYRLPKICCFVNLWSDYFFTINTLLARDNGYVGKDILSRVDGILNKIDLYIWIDKGSVGKKDKVFFRYLPNTNGKQLRQDYFK